MTITFPRAMPAGLLRVATFDFQLRTSQMVSDSWGLVTDVVSVGRDRWTARYDTVSLSEDDASEAVAWLTSLRGGARRFKAIPPHRRTGRAYPNGYGGMTKYGGGSFTGSGVLQAVGEQLDTVTISGLPVGLVISNGDFLSFPWATTRQALHRVVEGATAGSTGVATVGIEPSVIPGFSLNVAVALADPYCHAYVKPGSVNENWTLGRRCSISFEAIQDLK